MPKNYAASGDWEPHRETIAQLYREESKTLQETMDIMARDYNFFATKWGLYKYRTGSQIQEMDGFGFDNGVRQNTSEVVVVNGCEYYHHSDTASLRRHIRQGWDPANYSACPGEGGSSNNEGKIHNHIPLGHLLADMPISIPTAMRAPMDLQRVEESLRITDSYIQGCIESGTWAYDEQFRGICGRRGLDGWDAMWAWLCRLVEAVQCIQVARTRAGGFRLLGACLDEMPAHLRYQDSTTVYYLLVLTKIRNRGVRQSLVRHTLNLARVVLGRRHPFTLTLRREIWANDPAGAAVVALIGFDLLLAVVRGLRLHGETAEAVLALDAAGRWLASMRPDVYERRAAVYRRELKAFADEVLLLGLGDDRSLALTLRESVLSLGSYLVAGS
ncbi:hypothetical protein UCREL1_5164 [Eutypa lata UCREL1]|uniref:Clr5 domain-containing protein n=1 Tax=Eutypa lata (strain UCR-EL1) TaxID=1287681 RepID=M7SU49_EUTLA|nr:hypothetical protein UCREL1_5164 [Eutypa lata UCREL1]